jgi:streptogramin lyase
MLVTSREGSRSILRYDDKTGAFLDTFVSGGTNGLTVPNYMAIGPDGNLYVSEFAPNGSIRRYSPGTGDFIDIFAEGDGFSGVFGPQFGPDGNLYVGRFEAGEIARYDRATGDFIDVFVPHGEGGVEFLNGFTFGPGNNLYVGSGADIQQFDGTTGEYLGVFATTPNLPADANLNRPLFGPDGNLYARNIAANSIERYNGTTGDFLDTFASGHGLSDPLGFTFGPDGNLYVASTGNDRILRYSSISPRHWWVCRAGLVAVVMTALAPASLRGQPRIGRSGLMAPLCPHRRSDPAKARTTPPPPASRSGRRARPGCHATWPPWH